METKIPIRNIYYMLAYAYKSLQLNHFQSLRTEEFERVQDLYAEILNLSVSYLLKRGLYKEYIFKQDEARVIRGKIQVNRTIQENLFLKKKMMVEYDVFSENNLLNQILKTTMMRLSRSQQVTRKHRKKIKNLLLFFSEVEEIELNKNKWQAIQYSPQNAHYQLPIDICRFLYESALLDESGSTLSFHGVSDDQYLSSLYENFVFEFYRLETNYSVSRPQIQWQTDNHFSAALPVMQTDIVLKNKKKTLIIDTKFYQKNMVRRSDEFAYKQHAGNLYQIFAYVENYPRSSLKESVDGMLLYARTTDDEQPDHHYQIKGHKIGVVTLDLFQDFSGIKRQLLDYAAQMLR